MITDVNTSKAKTAPAGRAARKLASPPDPGEVGAAGLGVEKRKVGVEFLDDRDAVGAASVGVGMLKLRLSEFGGSEVRVGCLAIARPTAAGDERKTV